MNLRYRKLADELLDSYQLAISQNKMPSINLSMAPLFLKQELIEILKHCKQDIARVMDHSKMTKEQLLKAIGDEYHLIRFIRTKLYCAPTATYDVSRELITKVLTQLRLTVHYLHDKPIGSYDSYDLSNVHQLLLKAGLLKRVYGLYDSSVTQSEVETVSSEPKVYFDSMQEAELELSYLLEQGHRRRKDIVILYRDVFVKS